MAKRKIEINPLSVADHDDIQDKLKLEEAIHVAIERAERCGVNCTQARQQLSSVVNGLRTILEEHFPNGRPR